MRSAISMTDVSEPRETSPSFLYQSALTVAPMRAFASTPNDDVSHVLADFLTGADTFLRRRSLDYPSPIGMVIRTAWERCIDARIYSAGKEADKAYPFHPTRYKQLRAEIAELRAMKANSTAEQTEPPSSLNISMYWELLLPPCKWEFSVVGNGFNRTTLAFELRSWSLGFREYEEAVFYHSVFNSYLGLVKGLQVTVRKFGALALGMTIDDVSRVFGFAGEVDDMDRLLGHGEPPAQDFTGVVCWENGYLLRADFDKGRLRDKEIADPDA